VGLASSVDELIHGAIDIHVHFGPDAFVDRRTNALTLARSCREVGLRAIVLKSHEQPTQLLAHAVGLAVPEVQVFGGVCLNDEVGGINPRAVEATARIGGKLVWFPTSSAAADRSARGRGTGGISIVHPSGGLSTEAGEVLEIAREYDLVVASGHLSMRETLSLFGEARRMGVSRLVVTHVSTLTRWYGLRVEDVKQLAMTGAYLEHSVNVFFPLALGLAPGDMIEIIRSVGAERCMLSSDLGIWNQPLPPEGLRTGVAYLLSAGMSMDEVELLVKHNPASLLDLGQTT
jgi:hypothetical protein